MSTIDHTNPTNPTDSTADFAQLFDAFVPFDVLDPDNPKQAPTKVWINANQLTAIAVIKPPVVDEEVLLLQATNGQKWVAKAVATTNEK